VPPTIGNTLKPDEVTAMISALDQRWRALFVTAVFTGLRKGELLGLRREDVDLVSAMQASSSDLVFPGPDGKIQRRDVALDDVLRRALGRAGIVVGYACVPPERVRVLHARTERGTGPMPSLLVQALVEAAAAARPLSRPPPLSRLPDYPARGIGATRQPPCS
jgi:integrase